MLAFYRESTTAPTLCREVVHREHEGVRLIGQPLRTELGASPNWERSASFPERGEDGAADSRHADGRDPAALLAGVILANRCSHTQIAPVPMSLSILRVLRARGSIWSPAIRTKPALGGSSPGESGRQDSTPCEPHRRPREHRRRAENGTTLQSRVSITCSIPHLMREPVEKCVVHLLQRNVGVLGPRH